MALPRVRGYLSPCFWRSKYPCMLAGPGKAQWRGRDNLAMNCHCVWKGASSPTLEASLEEPLLIKASSLWTVISIPAGSTWSECQGGLLASSDKLIMQALATILLLLTLGALIRARAHTHCWHLAVDNVMSNFHRPWFLSEFGHFLCAAFRVAGYPSWCH